MLVAIPAVAAASASAQAAAPLARVARLGPAPASARVELVLPLVADVAGLERFAQAVSTPRSPSYGHYEPIARLARRFGASARTRRLVLTYLRHAGASAVKIDRTGLFADATVTAAVANTLFRAPLSEFRTARGARFLAPTAGARIPRGLRGLVTGVVGLDTRPLRPAQLSPGGRGPGRAIAHTASTPSSALPRTGTVSSDACPAGANAGELGGDPTTAGFAPNQYLTAYGFDPLHNAGYRGQGETVALIEIDGFNYNDIKAFAQCFHLDIPALNGYGVGSLSHKLPPGGEATLDIEVLDAAAPDLKSIDVYESRSNAADTLQALTAPLQNPGHKPQVISASLGLCEEALLNSVGSAGMRAADGALSMAAASGITILSSSGDQGSADCVSITGDPLDQPAVNYPASSWWVTGVGGTNFALSSTNQITSELVWNDTNTQPGSAGGGGFSDVFYRPSYQSGTVSQNSRAVPDVSMLADIIPGYAIYCTASGVCSSAQPWQAVGGTSAATPLLAGALAMVDQDLRLNKRADLGLVNPLLYSIGRSATAGSVFGDVRAYDNDIGPYVTSIGHPLGCCSAGPGYDEASGWGSVNVASFAAVALGAQPARETLTLPPGQRPVRNRKILAKISCTLACRMASYAVVQIGRATPFEVASRAYSLSSAGSKTIPLPFSSKQLSKLRAGLRQHKRILAEVFAVTLDSHNHELQQTDGKWLTIKA